MKKTILLAIVLAAFALPAIPALASAAPVIDFNAANPTFSGTFGTAAMTSANGNFESTGGNHVHGSYTTNANNEATTGTIQITFTGCKSTGFLSFPCTSAGQESGVIQTVSSVFHLVYIKGFVKTVGILITPGTNNEFASYSCSSFGNVVVKGHGVIGHVSSPNCGETSSSSTINFESSAAHVQKYQEIEGSATEIHLETNLNGRCFRARRVLRHFRECAACWWSDGHAYMPLGRQLASTEVRKAFQSQSRANANVHTQKSVLLQSEPQISVHFDPLWESRHLSLRAGLA